MGMPTRCRDVAVRVLYVLDMTTDAGPALGGRIPGDTRIIAWRPAVRGVRAVLQARFGRHAYPMHTHDMWTLMILGSGATTP
jgi:hypothetical protein